jgi:hypothetical protein
MTTPELALVKDAVASGLIGVSEAFGSERVRAVPDGQGGAWIEISAVDLGGQYAQDASFAICLLPFTLPAADVYPLFLRADLSRRDGSPLGEGFTPTAVVWPGDPTARSVMQVSRRTRRNEFTLQTPVQKIQKVLDWVRSR